MNFYSGYQQVLETYLLIVGCQAITAYVCINVLMPKFLNQQKNLLFALYMLVLLFAIYALYLCLRINYLDVKYFEYYNLASKKYASLSFWKRLTDFPVLLSKSILFITPTGLLLLARFYKNQQKFLQLNEQKKTAELSALKNQLNPHFLFNTLNNLYALALKKSDKTPEVISKLSDILDYMLYRCNEKYVSLEKEIELIENYLTLEKIRYGKRVAITFETVVEEEVKIAPLLLLTFVENAFKHGVSQEINQATIDINLQTKANEIVFTIKNSIPKQQASDKTSKEAIGLKNVQQQLALLYPNAHQLHIQATTHTYTVHLNIKTL